MNEEFFNLNGGKKKMRKKDDILKEFEELVMTQVTESPVRIISNQLLIEVLIDIRDILQRELIQLSSKG